MMGMLNPVSFDDFYLVSNFNGKEHAINGIALLDLLKHPGIPGSERGRFIETFFYRFKKLIFILGSHMISLDVNFFSQLRLSFFSRRLIFLSSLPR